MSKRSMTKCLAVAAGLGGLVLLPMAHAAGGRERCEPSGTSAVSVALTPPAGIPLAGVKVRLDYPEQALGIPGSADAAEVKGRVRDMPSGVLAVPNDEGGRLVVAMVSSSSIPAGRIFTVEFDRCAGATLPAVERLACTVEEASDEQAKLVDGARCAVAPVNDKEGAKL